MPDIVLNISDYISTVILVYFVVTNAMYTVLMAVSVIPLLHAVLAGAGRR